MILARITSQYGDVYFLAIDSSVCRSSLERFTLNGLFLGIRDTIPLMQAYQITSPIRLLNTSSYFRIVVLSYWESSVADTRIHGTTRKQVAACFEEERPHLQPLPASLFPSFQEGRRSVHRDSYVEVERAFYEAPPELIGREVWVRWDSRCVRIFNERMAQVGMHTRQEPGKFSHSLGAGGFSAPVLSSCRYWVSRAAVLGEQCGQWAQSALDARGPESLRSIMGLCGLIRKHSGAVLNTACTKALKSGTHRLKDVRRLIGEPSEQTAFGFAQSHPLIRNLKSYSDFINHHQQSQNDD